MFCKTGKIAVFTIITLLSLAAGYGASVCFCGKVWGTYTENYITPVNIVNLAVFVLTFVFLYILLKVTDQYSEKVHTWISETKKSRLSKGKVFFIVFSLIVIAWAPYLLSFAPASVLGDSLDSIRMVVYSYYRDNMPIMYTLFIRLFLWVGNLSGSINRGLFAYACFQYLCLALTCTSIVVWLYMHNVKTVIVLIAALFYALFPAFPAYAITMWKDPVFSIGLAALSFILLNKKSTWLQFLISTLIILFFRSNGLVIIAIITVIMICSKEKRIYVLLGTVAVVIFIIFNSALLHYFKAERCLEEALGIPLQQIAYTAVYDYDSLSETELENINRIISVDTIRNSYTPCLVDSIKWHEQFNIVYVRENIPEVVKTWLSLLPGHLGSYIKAYALETYGFWMPGVQSDYGYIDLYISENELGIDGRDLFNEIFGFSVKDKLANFKPFIGSGTLIWITLLGCVLCILHGQSGKLWFYSPGVLCWFSVMISTPVAFSLRYIFILIVLLPIYILIPFIHVQKKRAEQM